MKISIASGKGGTGKTTIATNLAFALSQQGLPTSYVDCDVEEPNGHLFLNPTRESRETVGITVPSVNQEQCTLCGLCGHICAYSAIVCVGQQVLTFPELCHSCGGCWLVCPQKAISESFRPMGVIEFGHAGSLQFTQGVLNIGEVMPTPVLRELKKKAPLTEVSIFDAPPGTSCPVIETILDSDYVLLVAEPTPFSFHDLKLAIEMVREIKLPFGVVLNKADVEYSDLLDYCNRMQIPILAQIPHQRPIAEAYSRGELLCSIFPEYTKLFLDIYKSIETEVGQTKGMTI